MLGKLMKYEFKSMTRIFLPIYVAILIVAAINRVFQISKISFGFGISTLILGFLFMGLSIITLILVIQRFNKNLLGDEGYLMFTLPVKSQDLIVSKLVIGFVWNVISAVVAAFSLMILFGNMEFFTKLLTNFSTIWREFDTSFRRDMHLSGVGGLSLVGVASIFCYVSIILKIYLSLATAQLPILNKHRWLAAFGTYCVINVITTIIISIVGHLIPEAWVNQFSSAISIAIVYLMVISVIYFICTKYILDKHLNLE